MPERRDALPPGTCIGGAFRLLRVMGQGGFGITYCASDLRLERTIVLKECFPREICRRNPETGHLEPLDPSMEDVLAHALDDMYREAQLLAQCRHPRIVPVYTAFRSNGSVFYAMPWLEGGTLADRGQLGPAQTEKVLRGLLDGLAYLHERHIIHRDIKASNILFDDDGEPVLIDFGAALIRPEQTMSQGPFSPSNAAPEQLTGKDPVGPWTDFYALAATLYNAILGRTGNPLLAADALPLSRRRALRRWPRALLRSIDRNLRVNPRARCASAADWLELLQPVPWYRSSALWCGAVVALSAAIGTVVALIPSADTQPPASPREVQHEEPPQQAKTTAEAQPSANASAEPEVPTEPMSTAEPSNTTETVSNQEAVPEPATERPFVTRQSVQPSAPTYSYAVPQESEADRQIQKLHADPRWKYLDHQEQQRIEDQTRGVYP